jgi:L-cystine transport system permease protein
MDWDLLGTSLWPIVKGAVTGTVPLALASFALGLALGLFIALMRLSRVRVVSGIARV